MTGQQVFDLAIRIMDEQNESTGATTTADTKEYALRSVDLLNSLGQECYQLSGTSRAPGTGERAVFPRIKALGEELDLDEYVAGVVLPYGLVYLLVEIEDPTLANTCLQRYQELKAEARRLMPPAEFAPIADVYGGVGCGEYAQW